MILGLLLLTAAAYSSIGRNSFVRYDDDQYITANPHVQAGLSVDTIGWAFTTFTAANWHPLTWISHATDFQLFGAAPAGHHWMSVGIHAANAALLYWFLRIATSQPWPSAFAAAIFALHPLRVESVAWAAEKKDLLCGFFVLLALIAYVAYTKRGGAGRYTVVAICLTLALLCKPMAVTLPFVLLLLDDWPLERSQKGWKKLVSEKFPLVMLCAASMIVTVIAQKAGNAIAPLTGEVTPGARVTNAVFAYARYLSKTCWPAGLAAFYPPVHPPVWQLSGATAILLVITSLAIIERKRNPFFLVGWLWFLGMLVPVIGLVQVGWQSMADRYTYLPGMGLGIIVAWGAWRLSICSSFMRVSVPLAAGLAGAAMIVMTAVQLGYWRNTTALFEHAIDVTENNAMAYEHLADVRSAAGHDPDAYYSKAIEIEPHFAEAHYNWGNSLLRRGRIPEAQTQFLDAIRDRPNFAQAYENLGVILAGSGDMPAAAGAFAKAVEADPDDAPTQCDFGMALLKLGRTREAALHFERALALDPQSASAQNGLAAVQGGMQEKP